MPIIIGWVLTVLLSAFLTFSAVGKLLKLSEVEPEVTRLGYTMETIFTIGIVELACVIVYLFPRTAVLGAILSDAGITAADLADAPPETEPPATSSGRGAGPRHQLGHLGARGPA